MSLNKKTYKGPVADLLFYFPGCYVTDDPQDIIELDYSRFILRTDNPERVKDYILSSHRFVIASSEIFTDYDLREKEDVVKMLSIKHAVSEEKLKFLLRMGYMEFDYYSKLLWVTGLTKVQYKNETKMYALFFSIGDIHRNIIQQYYKVLSYYSPTQVFRSFIKFFERIFQGTERVSNSYGKVISKLRNRRTQIQQNILQFICKYEYKDSIEFELGLLNLLLSL